jgi:signal peptidase I
MPKTKPAPSKTATKPAKSTATAMDDSNSWSRTLRETVESVVIAFILAFLFRTFEAEAFVIPTGSMAPALQGRHKDIVCPACGYEYRTGASREVDDKTGEVRRNLLLSEATCPNCRHSVRTSLDGENPSYSGDRIIVSKFAYDVSDPERWNVVVFKYPEDAKQNYIKRLVGMPNERLNIVNGDIYTAPLKSDDFKIERKGKKPEKLRAMLQLVYDNNYQASELVKAGYPARWQSWDAASQPRSWTASDDGRSFAIDGKNAGWLRYQHFVPRNWTAVDGKQVFDNKIKVNPPSEPSLITDYYAYNVGEFGGPKLPGDLEEWVGDLALTCDLEVKSNQGKVTLELIKGGRQFRATIDVATGKAQLSINGLSSYAPSGPTPIKGPGSYEVSFANVDEQLLLWVDGKVVEFNADTAYAPLNNNQPTRGLMPQPGVEVATDLSPVGIAAEGGAAVTVSNLRLERDIFYVSEDRAKQGMHNFKEKPIDIEAGHYLMLGDNSPQSKDSRYWYTVDRSLLIGKALFIYWPHSFNEIEIGSVKIPFPFFPNFGDMGFVR